MAINLQRRLSGPALYVSVRDFQLARFVVDTASRNGCYRPALRFAVAYGWTRSCCNYVIPRHLKGEVLLPHVSWRFVMRCGYARPVAWVYTQVQRAYLSLNGGS